MLIAKQLEVGFEIADYRAMFPNTSFGYNGPSDDFLAENNCYKVSLTKDHDQLTQKLVPAVPYLEGAFVYTVEVQPLSEADLAAKKAEEIEAFNREVYAQIKVLEEGQGRAIREATLTGDTTRLQAIDDAISALRLTLGSVPAAAPAPQIEAALSTSQLSSL